MLEVARATPTRRAVAGATVQVLFQTDLTDEDYVSQRAWNLATAPPCPWCRPGTCRLRSHGTYPRQRPAGAQVRRFLCIQSRKTVSLLPSCLASHVSGSLESIEQAVRRCEQARSLAPDLIRQVRVSLHRGTRLVRAHDARVQLPGYDGQLRQITVLRRPGSRRRPSLLLTNDFDSSLSQLLRRYARRWLIEKSIAEQLAFFHLNRRSSSMVIKVDFDLAMTVLAHNLYRLLALQLPPGFQHYTASTLFEKLLCTAADVTLDPTRCLIALKKNRNLPALLETLDQLPAEPIPWLGNRHLVFSGATRC